jgi:WD40 repeat protein
MSARLRIYPVITGFLLTICIIGIVTAAGLGHAWKERPEGEGSFSGLMFSSDSSMVFAGGSQLLVRSWDGDIRWGGRSGTIATMTEDGNRVITVIDASVRVFDKNGTELWTRTMGSSPIRAVAASANGSIVIVANDEGYIQSYDAIGNRWGLNKTDQIKKIAISPSQSLVVALSEAGLKFFSPDMEQVWVDNRSGSLDKFVAISADSATIITAGDTRVWSHRDNGYLNWMKEATRNAITDMACSKDCTTIVLGSQDGEVQVLNQLGQTRWKFPAGSWVNGVAVSSDGSIIAASALDGTLYVLDKDGTLLATTKTDTVIRQGSVEINRDGTRIIVADQGALYGFDLLGKPEITLEETPLPTTLCPCTSATPVVTRTTISATSSSPVGTTIPVTTGTPKSSPGPYLAIIASAGVLFIMIKRNN